MKFNGNVDSRIILLMIVMCHPFISLGYKSNKGSLQFSDNPIVNSFISEVYVPVLPDGFNPIAVSMSFGLYNKTAGKYYNRIRVGDENLGKTGYVEVLLHYYDTEEDAIAALRTYKGILCYVNCYIKCDFSSIKTVYDETIKCNFYDITDVINSPSISHYMKDNNLVSTNQRVRSSATNKSISARDTYQCEDQFLDNSLVSVYANGKLLPKNKYKVYKQGKVQFYESLQSDKVTFEYNRFVTKYPSYLNSLSNNTIDFYCTSQGSAKSMKSFVEDPIDNRRKVLKISCDTIEEGSRLVRLQFAFDRYPLTKFVDRIKIFIPNDMKDALISFPSVFYWFSIQGAWCQFGSDIGNINEMYSGSETSFDIVKLERDDQELFYNLRCRRRHCNVETGKEEYDVLTEVHSDFPVKCGEWIIIEREWRVGNPGICNHTIIDSDGRHEFNVVAYNSVCDPENEAERYGEKYAGSNPYNYFDPFVCKIYTSKEVAQHCINQIGQCYLYFKDYEFLEGESVNILN